MFYIKKKKKDRKEKRNGDRKVNSVIEETDIRILILHGLVVAKEERGGSGRDWEFGVSR